MKKAIIIFIVVTCLCTGLIAQIGKVGINTTSPAAMFHVKDSSVIFTGAQGFPAAPGNPPVSGTGIRMMWYPDKAALRAGFVSDTQWNKENIGTASIALGANTKATAFYSTALGNAAIASGIGAAAIGSGVHASGINSIALGQITTASGQASTAIGLNTTASGMYSIASGYNALATGFNSFVHGFNAEASGIQSISLGKSTIAFGDNSFSTGISTAAKSYVSFVLGRWNDTTSLSSNSWNGLDPLFIIGNGSSNTLRSNAMTVLKNGNVGIGTTNPGFLLSFPNSLGDKISLWGSAGAHYGFGIQSNALQIHTDVSTSDIVFGYGSSAAFTETVRIRGNGNVGVGTTSPEFKLDVAARMRLQSGGTAGTSPGIWFNEIDNSGMAAFFGMYDIDHIGIYSGLVGVWFYRMNMLNGNLGLGVTPTEKLHVAGNGLFTGTVTASCGVLTCSDIRYKTNIQPLTNSLNNILSLQGIRYDWNTEKFPEKSFSNESQIGFSAQELEKIFPEMVHTDENGYKTVDYTRLTPVLVEAIKEQQKQINFLLKELSDLKSRYVTMNQEADAVARE